MAAASSRRNFACHFDKENGEGGGGDGSSGEGEEEDEEDKDEDEDHEEEDNDDEENGDQSSNLRSSAASGAATPKRSHISAVLRNPSSILPLGRLPITRGGRHYLSRCPP